MFSLLVLSRFNTLNKLVLARTLNGFGERALFVRRCIKYSQKTGFAQNLVYVRILQVREQNGKQLACTYRTSGTLVTHLRVAALKQI